MDNTLPPITDLFDEADPDGTREKDAASLPEDCTVYLRPSQGGEYAEDTEGAPVRCEVGEFLVFVARRGERRVRVFVPMPSIPASLRPEFIEALDCYATAVFDLIRQNTTAHEAIHETFGLAMGANFVRGTEWLNETQGYIGDTEEEAVLALASSPDAVRAVLKKSRDLAALHVACVLSSWAHSFPDRFSSLAFVEAPRAAEEIVSFLVSEGELVATCDEDSNLTLTDAKTGGDPDPAIVRIVRTGVRCATDPERYFVADCYHELRQLDDEGEMDRAIPPLILRHRHLFERPAEAPAED